MINLNKHRIDFGKGDEGIGVIGNTTDSAQLAFYNQSARPSIYSRIQIRILGSNPWNLKKNLLS